MAIMNKSNPGPSDEAREILYLLQKELLESYRREFDYVSSTFRDLDGKAQGASAIAGIFLAAVLAFVNRQGVLDTLPLKTSAVLGVVCLIASLVFSLQALQVRQILPPPSGDDIGRLLRDLRTPLALIDIRDRVPNFHGDMANLWMESVRERRSVNDRKAIYIRRAQKTLAASAIFAAIIILTVLLGG